MNTMRWDRQTRLALALVLVFSGAMVSCRSGEYPTVPASGTVTYKGAPLEKGQIQLVPDKEGPVAVGSIENGKFVLGTNQEGNGALPGKYRVTVFSYKDVQSRYGGTTTQSVIPTKYADPEKSGLIVEIPAGGKTDIKIDLNG
jgi:hypothetical protein